MNFTLKNILITVSSIAGVLGIISFYVVFYGNSGTYVVNSAGSSNTVFSTSTVALPSSTVSSTLSLGSSTTSSTLGLGSGPMDPSSGEYASNYTAPPINWTEGNEQMYVTNAALNGSQLTLELQITMGNTPECVPLNLKLVVDENGDTTSPVTPQFTFPDSGTCAGSPGETYSDQQVVFSLDPTAMPVILTTGGKSNVIFEIDTTPAGGLTIQLPPSAG